MKLYSRNWTIILFLISSPLSSWLSEQYTQPILPNQMYNPAFPKQYLQPGFHGLPTYPASQGQHPKLSFRNQPGYSAIYGLFPQRELPSQIDHFVLYRKYEQPAFSDQFDYLALPRQYPQLGFLGQNEYPPMSSQIKKSGFQVKSRYLHLPEQYLQPRFLGQSSSPGTAGAKTQFGYQKDVHDLAFSGQYQQPEFNRQPTYSEFQGQYPKLIYRSPPGCFVEYGLFPQRVFPSQTSPPTFYRKCKQPELSDQFDNLALLRKHPQPGFIGQNGYPPMPSQIKKSGFQIKTHYLVLPEQYQQMGFPGQPGSPKTAGSNTQLGYQEDLHNLAFSGQYPQLEIHKQPTYSKFQGQYPKLTFRSQLDCFLEYGIFPQHVFPSQTSSPTFDRKYEQPGLADQFDNLALPQQYPQPGFIGQNGYPPMPSQIKSGFQVKTRYHELPEQYGQTGFPVQPGSPETAGSNTQLGYQEDHHNLAFSGQYPKLDYPGQHGHSVFGDHHLEPEVSMQPDYSLFSGQQEGYTFFDVNNKGLPIFIGPDANLYLGKPLGPGPEGFYFSHKDRFGRPVVIDPQGKRLYGCPGEILFTGTHGNFENVLPRNGNRRIQPVTASTPLTGGNNEDYSFFDLDYFGKAVFEYGVSDLMTDTQPIDKDIDGKLYYGKPYGPGPGGYIYLNTSDHGRPVVKGPDGKLYFACPGKIATDKEQKKEKYVYTFLRKDEWGRPISLGPDGNEYFGFPELFVEDDEGPIGRSYPGISKSPHVVSQIGNDDFVFYDLDADGIMRFIGPDGILHSEDVYRKTPAGFFFSHIEPDLDRPVVIGPDGRQYFGLPMKINQFPGVK